jgi:hypothetical protein
MLFRRTDGGNAGNESDVATDEEGDAAMTSSPRQPLSSRYKSPRDSNKDRDSSASSSSSIFKPPPLKWMFLTIVLLISSVMLHIGVTSSSQTQTAQQTRQQIRDHMLRLHEYNSQLESQITQLKEAQQQPSEGHLASAFKHEMDVFKSFVSKEAGIVSGMFTVNNHTIDMKHLQQMADAQAQQQTATASEEAQVGQSDMSKWADRLVQKLTCLYSGSGALYLYHVRKAAGTTLREIMATVAHTWKVKLYETEGIVLDHRFVENDNLLSVVTLRHPVKRVMSLYWYEHVGWWHGILKETSKVRTLRDWVDGWKDGSKWKTDFVRKNPGTVYVEIENYYVKMLTGWKGGPTVGSNDLEKAKQVLDKFDLVLLVEWMQDDTQITALNAIFPGRTSIAPGQKLKGDTRVKDSLGSKFAKDEV